MILCVVKKKSDMENNPIAHAGIITEVKPEGIEVKLSGDLACSSCHAKGSCGAAESSDKIIFIPHLEKQYSKGEIVEVAMSSNLGLKAVFIGYVLPFLLLMGTIIIGLTFTTEVLASLMATAVVAIYYTVLYFSRKTMKEAFTLSIKN